MEYWYKISIWPSFWPVAVRCGSLTKRWALWIHLVEAVPDLLQIVQKDKTMGVNSLQSPTIGLLDVHKYSQRLFKFPETASQRSRDSVWYFLNLFPSGFEASQQPFGANYQILIQTENKPITEPICSIYFPGTQGGKKAQRKSNRDDDDTSHWVAGWTGTVAGCESDSESGKQRWLCGVSDSLLVWWTTLTEPPGPVNARLLFHISKH